VATGLQEKFDWKGVAAAAAGAAASQAVGDALLGDSQWNAAKSKFERPGGPNADFADLFKGSQQGMAFTARVLSGAASNIVSQVVRGGRVEMREVMTDSFGNAVGAGFEVMGMSAGQSDQPSDAYGIAVGAFGNALGDSLVNSMKPQPTGAVFNLDDADMDAEAHVAAAKAKASEPWFTDEEIEAGTRRSPGGSPSLKLAGTAALGTTEELAAEVAAMTNQDGPSLQTATKRRAIARADSSLQTDGQPKAAGAGRGFINPPLAGELSPPGTSGVAGARPEASRLSVQELSQISMQRSSPSDRKAEEWDSLAEQWKAQTTRPGQLGYRDGTYNGFKMNAAQARVLEGRANGDDANQVAGVLIESGSAGTVGAGMGAGVARLGGRLNARVAQLAQEGHALARHGGSVTDDELLVRANTGFAPDGSVVVNAAGQVRIPPSSTAFNSDELLARADMLVRQKHLAQAIALEPAGATRVTVKGVDTGSVVGRGYDRVQTAPGGVGPLQYHDNLTRVTGTYVYDNSSRTWKTLTLYPSK